MPNWCFNRLEITGERKQLREFKEKAKAENTMLLLDKLYPMPGELKNTESPAGKESQKLREKYRHDNWFDWCVSNWGTKWDVKAEIEKDSECEHGKTGDVTYIFDSAWSPPIGWLEKVSKDYPALTFWLRYEEPGMGFMGVACAENGVVDDEW